MTADSARLIIITPIYEDRTAFRQLVEDIAKFMPGATHVVAVDDGSVIDPLTLQDLKTTGVTGTLLSLRRNVGHQRAIAIGLGHVADKIGDEARVVIMDSDGEDRPSSIAALLKALAEDGADVAVAQRRRRSESLSFRIYYSCYKVIFRLLTGREISFGNFMAMTGRAARRLATMHELSVHVAASVLASRLRTALCPLDRSARYAGESRMNFVALVLHGFKALMIFAEDVLVRVGIACAIIAALAVAGGLAAIALKLIGFSTPGWFSIALGILVLMFLQTGTLALMTLMLTGVVRSGTVTVPLAYHDFVASIAETGEVAS